MAVKSSGKRDRRAEATRGTLLAAARRLFARRGYPGVSIDGIVRAARVTKGALYHHFRDKKELFRAVVEQIERETRDRLRRAAARPRSARGRLEAVCAAYLDACAEEGFGRIVTLDSPAVLGWVDWCRLNRDYGLGVFVDRLRDILGDEKTIDTSAQMLLGALNVAGRVIAEAADRPAARRQVGPTIDRLLVGILGPA